MANQSIRVPRGDVVGIGKLEIHGMMEKFGHEIPMFSFITIKKPDGLFVTTCIHLRIDGYGDTVEAASSDMADNVCYFLSHNFSEFSFEDAWSNIRSLETPDEWSNELWVAYHEVQFQRAMRGKPDPVAELISHLARAEEKAKEWERVAKDNAEVAAIILHLAQATEKAKEWERVAKDNAEVACYLMLNQVIKRTLGEASD